MEGPANLQGERVGGCVLMCRARCREGDCSGITRETLLAPFLLDHGKFRQGEHLRACRGKHLSCRRRTLPLRGGIVPASFFGKEASGTHAVVCRDVVAEKRSGPRESDRTFFCLVLSYVVRPFRALSRHEGLLIHTAQ